MTNKQIYNYFCNVNEHYPISDLFMQKYRQAGGGYRKLAAEFDGNILKSDKWFFEKIKNKDGSYDKKFKPKCGEYEPNQKWHLLVSYFAYSYLEMDDEEREEFWKYEPENWKFKKKGNAPIFCPELVLWMAEAAIDEKNMLSEDIHRLFYELIRFKEQAKGKWKDDGWWKENSQKYWEWMMESIKEKSL